MSRSRFEARGCPGNFRARAGTVFVTRPTEVVVPDCHRHQPADLRTSRGFGLPRPGASGAAENCRKRRTVGPSPGPASRFWELGTWNLCHAAPIPARENESGGGPTLTSGVSGCTTRGRIPPRLELPCLECPNPSFHASFRPDRAGYPQPGPFIAWTDR